MENSNQLWKLVCEGTMKASIIGMKRTESKLNDLSQDKMISLLLPAMRETVKNNYDRLMMEWKEIHETGMYSVVKDTLNAQCMEMALDSIKIAERNMGA